MRKFAGLVSLATLAVSHAAAPVSLTFDESSENTSRFVPLPVNPHVDEAAGAIVYSDPDVDHSYNFLASRDYISSLGDCYNGEFEIHFQINTEEAATIAVGETNPWPKLVLGSSSSEFAMMECQLQEDGSPSHWTGLETNTALILEGYLDNLDDYTNQDAWTGVYADGTRAAATEEQIQEVLGSVSFVFLEFAMVPEDGVAYTEVSLSQVRLKSSSGAVMAETRFGESAHDTDGWVVLVETPEMNDRTDSFDVQHDAENGWISVTPFADQGDDIGYFMFPLLPVMNNVLAVDIKSTNPSSSAALETEMDVVVFGAGYEIYTTTSTTIGDDFSTIFATFNAAGDWTDENGAAVDDETMQTIIDNFVYMFVRSRYFVGSDCTVSVDAVEIMDSERVAFEFTVSAAPSGGALTLSTHADVAEASVQLEGDDSATACEATAAGEFSCPVSTSRAAGEAAASVSLTVTSHPTAYDAGSASVSILEPTCEDGVLNGNEKGVDCGGDCSGCPDGTACDQDSDCITEQCLDSVCVAPTCSDEIANGDETDVDCGGPDCDGCAPGQTCGGDSDCTDRCVDGTCVGPACDDELLNGDESDVDCGGSCDACPEGGACSTGDDCETGYCTDGVCVSESCDDGVLNQDETDVDCGGVCLRCDGDTCHEGAECMSGSCIAARCRAPTCDDGAQNQGEAGVDCGGPCENVCPVSGCTDPNASNYNAAANTYDSSCEYQALFVAGQVSTLTAFAASLKAFADSLIADATIVMKTANAREDELVELDGGERLSEVVQVVFDDALIAENRTLLLTLNTDLDFDNHNQANSTRRLLDAECVEFVYFTASSEEAAHASNETVWSEVAGFSVDGNDVLVNITRSGFYVALAGNGPMLVEVDDNASESGTTIGVIIAAVVALLLFAYIQRTSERSKSASTSCGAKSDDIPLVGV
eukprot:Rmarinus@m.15418